MTCANQVLVKNSVHSYVFAERVRNLLSKGRAILQNIIITHAAKAGNFFFNCAHLMRSFSKRFKILLTTSMGG